MKCLFCKEPSHRSRSREHVIPESLGNTTMLLSPGVVCDKCNNYFARKVERPLLESPEVRHLRFEEAVPNKRGRVPSATGVWGPSEVPVHVERATGGPLAGVITVPDARVFVDPTRRERSCLEFGHPGDGQAAGDDVWSRFLAKVALEAMAHRLLKYPDGLEYLATEPALDPVRFWARYGQGGSWPFSSRRIYSRHQPWEGANGWEQRVWECDFLIDPVGAWYFVVALFGQEFAINVGHREIAGYRLWLWRLGHESPLYRRGDIYSEGAVRSPNGDFNRLEGATFAVCVADER